MTKFTPVEIDDDFALTLKENGNVELYYTDVGRVGTMSYYYTRNDLPLFICRHNPSASLKTIHDVMVKLDDQMQQMIECGCLVVGGKNVAIQQIE